MAVDIRNLISDEYFQARRDHETPLHLRRYRSLSTESRTLPSKTISGVYF